MYEKKKFTGLNNVNYYQVYANKITDLEYEVASKLLKTTTTDVVRDLFGNVTSKSSVISGSNNANVFKTLDTYSYKSNGEQKKFSVLSFIDTPTTQLETDLSSYQFGIEKYCATNGKVYIKPNDQVVLIHGDIDIPLILKRFDHYYRYDREGDITTNPDYQDQNGNLVRITASEFNQAKPTQCGRLSYRDFDGDGKKDFATDVTAVYNKTELITVG